MKVIHWKPSDNINWDLQEGEIIKIIADEAGHMIVSSKPHDGGRFYGPIADYDLDAGDTVTIVGCKGGLRPKQNSWAKPGHFRKRI